jgi:hypothetical protein
MGVLDRIPSEKGVVRCRPGRRLGGAAFRAHPLWPRALRGSILHLSKVEHLDAVGFEPFVGNAERIGFVMADTAMASGGPRSRCRAAMVTEMQSFRDLDVIRHTPDRIARPCDAVRSRVP